MKSVNTTLTTSGKSVAVRLPKALMQMSGLGKQVTLQVKNGQIISKATNRREGWKRKIEEEIAPHGQLSAIDDYGDMLAENDVTLSDGLK